jgi:hypothetical protein
MVIEILLKFLLSLVLAGVAGLVGFVQWPHAQLGSRDGVVVGLLSGMSWATASLISATSGWNSFFNLIAAVLAAMAVGYLAPAKAVCHPIATATAVFEWDTLPAFRAACDLRQKVTGIGAAEMYKAPG